MEFGAVVPSRLKRTRWVSACQRPYRGEVTSGSGSLAMSGTIGCEIPAGLGVMPLAALAAAGV